MCLILIADDHPIAREPLAKLLRYEGYETACAANGLEALQHLEGRRPDLILLDMMMPKMGGLEFLLTARMRHSLNHAGAGTGSSHDGAASSEVTGDIPVILLTSVTDTPDVARARSLGVVDVIPKAKFTLDELLHRLRAHLPHDSEMTGV